MDNTSENTAPRSWMERYGTWLISLTFHSAIAALVVAVVVLVEQKFSERAERVMVVPGSFEDPSFSDRPGAMQGGGDSPMDPRDRLRALANADGFAATGSQDVAQLARGVNTLEGIFTGTGASLNNQSNPDRGSVAAYGTPGAGGSAGPRSSFYGTGGNAKRIVYLIDRTGSLGNYYGSQGASPAGTVKNAVEQSVSRLVPLQSFAVLVFTGDLDGGTQSVGSADLVIATPENKQAVLAKLRDTVAQGGINDLETVFMQAFRKAFAMKPELIYFLTDGDMGAGVLGELRRLNPDKGVKINAVMFTQNAKGELTPGDQARLERMTDLATQNGGSAKVVWAEGQ